MEQNRNERTTEVWEEFNQYIRNFIISKIGNSSDADDLLQEVFLKIHHNIDKLNDASKLKSWIFQIARNSIHDYHRKAKPEPCSCPAPEQESNTDEEYEIKLNNVTTGLKGLIDDLPEKYAYVLRRVEIDGISQTELANELNMSVSGVKSRVQRGRQLIKNTLLECCSFQFDKYGTFIDYEPKQYSKAESRQQL